MTVVWSLRAVAHLSHLREHIARDNPNAASRLATLLLDTVDRLAIIAMFHGRQKWPTRF